MKITENQLKTKKVSGKTDSGDPVLYVETLGGLHLFFTKKNGKLISLSAAPHRAIAQWMAEKKEKIVWDKDFLQKTEGYEDSLEKSEKALYKRLREVLWSKPGAGIESNRGKFLLFRLEPKTFEIYETQDLVEAIQKNEVGEHDVIRELSLDTPPRPVFLHKVFRKVGYGV